MHPHDGERLRASLFLSLLSGLQYTEWTQRKQSLDVALLLIGEGYILLRSLTVCGTLIAIKLTYLIKFSHSWWRADHSIRTTSYVCRPGRSSEGALQRSARRQTRIQFLPWQAKEKEARVLCSSNSDAAVVEAHLALVDRSIMYVCAVFGQEESYCIAYFYSSLFNSWAA